MNDEHDDDRDDLDREFENIEKTGSPYIDIEGTVYDRVKLWDITNQLKRVFVASFPEKTAEVEGRVGLNVEPLEGGRCRVYFPADTERAELTIGYFQSDALLADPPSS